MNRSVREIGKYLTKEKSLAQSVEANRKLAEFKGVMEKTLAVGLDGLDPADREIINGFNDVMNTEYGHTYAWRKGRPQQRYV